MSNSHRLNHYKVGTLTFVAMNPWGCRNYTRKKFYQVNTIQMTISHSFFEKDGIEPDFEGKTADYSTGNDQ